MHHIIMPGISYFLATYRAEQLIVCLNPPSITESCFNQHYVPQLRGSPKKLLRVSLKQGFENVQKSTHFHTHLALLTMLISVMGFNTPALSLGENHRAGT